MISRCGNIRQMRRRAKPEGTKPCHKLLTWSPRAALVEIGCIHLYTARCVRLEFAFQRNKSALGQLGRIFPTTALQFLGLLSLHAEGNIYRGDVAGMCPRCPGLTPSAGP